MRTEVQRSYQAGDIARAQDRLVQFFEDELRSGYLPIARPRLDAAGLPLAKVAVFRVLGHVIPLWAELYAPIAPFSMEAIHRAFRGESESVFERRLTPAQEPLLDARLEASYTRWRSVLSTLQEYRKELGLPADARLPAVVLSVGDDAIATGLRAEHTILERLGRVAKVEVASPSHPWDGRRVRARPVLEELQKAYPYQAQRMLRIHEGMNPARIQEALRTRSLELVLESHPLPIAANMVEVTEALPDGVVPIAWEDGEMFVTVPKDQLAQGEAAPPLSPDGFRLLRSLRRRIDRSATPSAVDRVEIAATGAIGDELTKYNAALSRLLQGVEVVVASSPSRFPGGETTRGRTRRGARWAIWIPGVPITSKPFHRTARVRRARLRATGRPIGDDVSFDVLDESVRARDAAIRDAVEAFDRALGRPLVGPSKLAEAWDAGLTSFEAVAHAPYEQLVAVPGFGPTVAAAVVRGFGGTPPTRVWPSPASHRPTVAIDPL
ncbi:MAG: class I tRNA ligase family protein, partial [Thermoplasmata archaeon]|nr:class I tRNA ligase family protein [Thermoplasmata archaeon]